MERWQKTAIFLREAAGSRRYSSSNPAVKCRRDTMGPS